MQVVHGAQRFGFDRKSEYSCETNRAHQAQRIFRKALVRVAHATNDFIVQVFLPAERVNDSGCGAVGHGVDRQVAPRKVIPNIGRECNAVRVAAVCVISVHAKRCYLVRFVVDEQCHRTVLKAGL